MSFTASAVPRLRRCPASGALPQINTSSSYAEHGNDGHEVLSNFVGAVREGRELIVGAEWMPMCEAVLPYAKHLHTEIAFAIDLGTGEGRILGVNIGRDYKRFNLGPMEVPGTADLGGYTDDAVIVIDAKLGWGPVEPARDHRQLHVLALMAAKAWGRDAAKVAILRAPEGATPWWDWADLDGFDLDDTLEELRRIWTEIGAASATVAMGRVPNVTEGPHCKYCPAAPCCPAKTALIRRLAAGTEAEELDMMKPLSPETAGLAYRRLQYAKAVLKPIEAAIMACLSEHGELPMPEGTVLRKVIGEGNEKLDGDVVWQVISEIADRELADEAVERKATKKQIGVALRKRFGKKGAETERQVLEAVRSRGGSERGVTERLEEVPVGEARRLAR